MATTIELGQHAELSLSRAVESARKVPRPAAVTTMVTWARAAAPTCAMVTTAWLGLVIASLIQPSLKLTPSRVVLLAMTIAAMHHWLRSVFGMSSWIAIPLSILYIGHPLVRQVAFGGVPVIGGMVLFAIPLIGIAASWMARHAHPMRIAALAILVGGFAALQSMAAWQIVSCLVIVTAIQRTAGGTRRKTILIATKNIVLALIVAISSMNLSQWAMARSGGANGTALGHAIAPITPLALIDRAGWVSARLASIAAIHPEAGCTWYIGWGLLALALIGCTSAQRTDVARPTGLLIAAMLLLIWCGLGNQSLHVQLRELFEYVTVRRRVDPMTLNLVGLLIVPLMMLMALGFGAMTSVFNPTHRRLSLVGIMAGVMVMLAWWTTCPAMLPDALHAPATALASSKLPQVMIAFVLSTSAAIGLTQLLKRFTNKREVALVWLLTLVCLSFELSHAASPIPSTHESNQPTSAPSTK